MKAINLFNKLLIVNLFALFLFSMPSYAATYYMPGNFSNLQAAFAAMSSGDTLIISDGVYTGTSNVIHGSAGGTPPNGTPAAYTTIKAQNNGGVVFDGEGIRMMFNIAGGTHSYLKFEGIKWLNSSNNAVLLSGADHIKFFRCGATNIGGAATWQINSQYVLLEECYAWGKGRYGFNVFSSDYVILRRCVDRRDDVNGGGLPIANFQDYISHFVEFQNCIAIDTDDTYFSNFSETEGAFDMHVPVARSTENAWWRGVIALNINMDRAGDMTGWRGRFGGSATWDDVYNINFDNILFWDVTRGLAGSMNSNAVSVDHATIGKSTSPGFEDGWYNSKATAYGSITNSIIYGHARYGLYNIGTSNFNSFYGNGTDHGSTTVGTNDKCAANGNAVDPLDGIPGNGVAALKYLVRVESGSNLKGAGSSGDIGANISKRIGVSGTLYGEPGYNTVTQQDLWPFPYEDQIRSDFRTYAGTAPANRGFCADGKTLTKYIWEYLGNPIPSGIYIKPNPPLLLN